METNDTDPYQQDFTMSAANRQKIFDLAQKLNYFQGDFASRMKHIAQTGQKTLQYQSPQVQGSDHLQLVAEPRRGGPHAPLRGNCHDHRFWPQAGLPVSL